MGLTFDVMHISLDVLCNLRRSHVHIDVSGLTGFAACQEADDIRCIAVLPVLIHLAKTKRYNTTLMAQGVSLRTAYDVQHVCTGIAVLYLHTIWDYETGLDQSGTIGTRWRW